VADARAGVIAARRPPAIILAAMSTLYEWAGGERALEALIKTPSRTGSRTTICSPPYQP
jgi:hypothetical protein